MDTNTITVTGCGDCILCVRLHDVTLCTHPATTEFLKVNDIFDVCPLKTNSLTITLKQDVVIKS